MGKFRAHQVKNRRRRGKTQQKMRGNDAAATVGGANGQGRQGEPRKPQVDQEETAVGAAGAGAVAGAACVNKKNPKVLTYSKEHSVLICGDGDFSFTRGVIRHRGTGLGVVATSFDSRKTVLKKYPRAKSWLPQLDEDGAQHKGVGVGSLVSSADVGNGNGILTVEGTVCLSEFMAALTDIVIGKDTANVDDQALSEIAHCVDATRLHETLFDTSVTEDNDAKVGTVASTSSGNVEAKHVMLFDRVVFNFPHTGKQRTHLNRNLIRDFFSSTRDLVKCAADGGEVHVTLKNKRPYSDWNIRAMAKESGLVLVRSLPFDPSVFPGYGHSTTDPKAKEFDAAGAKTHVFCRARSAVDDNVDASGGFPTIVKSSSMDGDGALQVTRKGADKSAVESAVEDIGDGGEEDEDYDKDVLNALLQEEVEEDDNDDWDMWGKAEEDLEVSTGTVGENGLFPRNGVGEGDNAVTLAGERNERHSGKLMSSSGSKTTACTKRERDNSKSKGQVRAGVNSPAGGSDSKKEEIHDKLLDSKESEAGHNKEWPHVLQKKKAAKRRAQRKKAAAIKKAAEVAAVDGFEEASVGHFSVEKVSTEDSLPKRKRGKYVRSGKRQRHLSP